MGTVEAQRALHDRANLQHQLAFTISRVNAEREEKEAILAEQRIADAEKREEEEEEEEEDNRKIDDDHSSSSSAPSASSSRSEFRSNSGVGDYNNEKKSSELEELKWKKETMEMEVGKLREEMEMICRDRDEGKSQLKVKTLEIVEKQAKC